MPHHDDDAGRPLDVNDVAAGTPLDTLTSNAAPKQRAPAVIDLNFLPDMCRMTAQLLLEDAELVIRRQRCRGNWQQITQAASAEVALQ